MYKRQFFVAAMAQVAALLVCTSLLLAGDLIEVGRLAIPGRASMHIQVDSDYAYVVRRGFPNGPETFSVVNIANKTAPWIEGKIDDLPYFHNAFDLCYNNGYAYTAHRFGGVTMINVSNPASPFVQSTAPSTYTHFGIMSLGNYLYVADHSAYAFPGGTRIFDVSGNNLNQVGAILGGIDGRDLVITSDGLYAYQSSGIDDWGTARLYTYDISNKTNPSVLSSIPDIFGGELLISSDDRYLFMTYQEPNDFTPPSKGIKIYDLSNRAQPVDVSTIALTNSYHITLDHGRKLLYVTAGYDPNYPTNPGIHVFDVSDPVHPAEIDYVSGTHFGDLFYAEDYLYAEEYEYLGPGNEIDDLVIFKVTLTPEEQMARILAFFEASVAQGTLRGRGHVPFLAALRLRAMRQLLVTASELLQRECTEGACFLLQCAYEFTDGLPSPPDLVVGAATPELASMILDLRTNLGCERVNSQSFTLDKEMQEMLQAAAIEPAEFRLEQNYPNPFNPETEIGFTLPAASQVSLSIYNALGQEIRRLAEEEFEAGYHSLRWDGKDNRGNLVPSGIYFYQLRAGTFSQVKKMSLMR